MKEYTGQWHFGGDFPDIFSDHIRCSVPSYDLGHEIICELSKAFCPDNGLCYEFGSSTGELTRRLAQANRDKKNFRIIGIDNEAAMVEKARSESLGLENISFIHSDASAFNFQPADFVAAYYCLQFMPLEKRKECCQAVYRALKPGGAFVLFEKAKSDNRNIQNALSSLHREFKARNGFSEEEILKKDRQLEGVLVPLTTEQNQDLLRQAGFCEVSFLFKQLCFEGYLAVKQ